MNDLFQALSEKLKPYAPVKPKLAHQHASLKRAASIISKADSLIVSAGAGIGVDSGLPDFRGDKGFWKAYPALGVAGISFADIASPNAFSRDPERAWGFYGHRLNMYRSTIPHQGFEILLKWMNERPATSWVFTSNVDGQFQKAGYADSNLHECHGSIHLLQCSKNCGFPSWSADDFHPQIDNATCKLVSSFPLCPNCGALARPNILMFDDSGWDHAHETAQRQAENQWLAQLRSHDVSFAVIEIGAGTAIPSVRNFSEHVAHEYLGPLIRINPAEYSVHNSSDVGISGGAFETLSSIASYLNSMS